MITIPIGFFTSGAFIGPTGPTGATGSTFAMFMGTPYSFYDSEYASNQAKYLQTIDEFGNVSQDPYVYSLGPNNEVLAFAVDGTGNQYFGGAFTLWGGTGNVVNRIYKTDANWQPDATFVSNIGTGFNNQVNKLEYDPIADKIVAAGTFTTYNGTTANRFARLNTDGTLDTSFMSNLGTGFNSSVNTVACDGTGGYYVMGAFTSYNGTTSNRLARINSDGTLDTTFASNVGTGPNSTSTVSYTMPVTGTQFYIGGNFTSYNGTSISRIARINSDGTLDTTFVGTSSGSIQDLALTSQGDLWAVDNSIRLILGATGGNANVTFVGGQPGGTVPRVYVDESDNLYSTWTALNPPSSVVPAGANYQIGKWVVSGSTATLDTDWGVFWGKYYSTSTTYVANLIDQPGSGTGIFVPGNTLYPAGVLHAPAMTFEITPGASATYSQDWKSNFGAGIGTGTYPAWVDVTPNNEFYIGWLGRVDGTALNNLEPVRSISKHYEDGTIDTSFLLASPGLTAGVNSILVDSAGDVLAAGFFTNGALTTAARYGIAKFDSTGSVPAGWECTGSTGGVYHISEGASGYYVGGAFTDFNGSLTNDRIVKIDKTTGDIDAGWNQADEPNDAVYITCPDEANNRVYVGGAFNDIALFGGGSTSGVGIAPFNISNGQVIQSGWAYGATSGDGFSVNGGNGSVYCITKGTGGKLYVGGQFNQYKADSVNYMARLNSDGTLDTSFDAALNGPTASRSASGSLLSPSINWIEEDPNGDVVVKFSGRWVNGGTATNHQGLVHLNPDGSLKTPATFGWGIVDNPTVFNFKFFTPNPFDPDATAFFNAVEGGGDTLTSTEKDAVNQLVLDLKADNLWNSFDAFYPLVGGTASSMKWNLKDPQDTDAAYRIEWYGTGTFSSTGFLGNSTDTGGDTNLNPNTEGYTQAVFGVYINDGLASTPSTAYDFGAYSGTQADHMISLGYSNKTTQYVNFNGLNYKTSTSGGYSAGMLLGQNDGTTTQLYQGSTQLISTAQNYQICTESYGLGCSWRGTVQESSPRGYATAFIGPTALNGTQITNLNTAIVNFNTTLGRN